ncbi:hypothetical protein LT493_04835 [Streptomyces tricolor]|nr:hypothetical protein [Streptomyces tricolor]
MWAAVPPPAGSEDDIAAFKRYLREHQRILAQYFEELYLDTIAGAEKQPA